jgi:hypothetical protein
MALSDGLAHTGHRLPVRVAIGCRRTRRGRHPRSVWKMAGAAAVLPGNHRSFVRPPLTRRVMRTLDVQPQPKSSGPIRLLFRASS